jgi:hypothetical protein
MSASSSDEMSNSVQILRQQKFLNNRNTFSFTTTNLQSEPFNRVALSQSIDTTGTVRSDLHFDSANTVELLRCVAGQPVQVHCDAYGSRPNPVFLWTLDDHHLLRSSAKNTKILQQSHPPLANSSDFALSDISSSFLFGSSTSLSSSSSSLSSSPAYISGASLLPSGVWAASANDFDFALQQLRLSPKNFGARNTLAFTPEASHNRKQLQCRVENPLLATKHGPLEHALTLDVQCKSFWFDLFHTHVYLL